MRALEASVTVKEGEEARLECEVQGNPHPTVSWKKQVRSQIWLVNVHALSTIFVKCQ